MSYLRRSRCDICRTFAGPGATCVVPLPVPARHVSYFCSSGCDICRTFARPGCDICRTFCRVGATYVVPLPSGCDICRTFCRLGATYVVPLPVPETPGESSKISGTFLWNYQVIPLEVPMTCLEHSQFMLKRSPGNFRRRLGNFKRLGACPGDIQGSW